MSGLSGKTLRNMFSNTAGMVVSVAIAFLVSPVLVRGLGLELYGVWALISSITGYFTVLDFGVNAAIVRLVSSAVAKEQTSFARKVFSTSFALFFAVAVGLLLFAGVFGFFLPDLFSVSGISRSCLYWAFLISALDLALGLLFSVYLGALTALQEFSRVNATSVVTNLVRSVLLVVGLRSGAGILFVAALQLAASLARAGLQYGLLRSKYRFLYLDLKSVDRKTAAEIFNYSVYSFVIAVALKLLFYTDSVVIAALIGVGQVGYYAIPSTLLDYLEKLVWSMIAVLVPVISGNEARRESGGNARLYRLGTRYSLMVSTPVVVSLYLYGGDFIRLWMGRDFGARSEGVLKYLLIGFGFSFSQLIAHGILKGISRHKVLAGILAVEAVANLVLSLALAGPYGIEGVALGTMVPLVLASLAIACYTCAVLELPLLPYLFSSYGGALAGTAAALAVGQVLDLKVTGYPGLIAGCLLSCAVFWAVSLPLTLERGHGARLLALLRERTGKAGAKVAVVTSD